MYLVNLIDFGVLEDIKDFDGVYFYYILDEHKETQVNWNILCMW